MKSRIVIFLFLFVSVFIISNTSSNWNGWVYTWDRSGYHLHLPSTFIYQDIKKLEFYSHIDEVYRPSGDHKNYCIYPLKNGNRVNRYNVGVAILESPFFLLTHFINTTFIKQAADGYSYPYQWGTILSSLFWTIMGLWALRNLLLRYFNDATTAITLLVIAFGTNLYHYVVFSGGMSHSYSFFHFALVMLWTDSLYRTSAKKYIYALAFLMGLIAITRSSNLLVLLIPLLWGVNNKSGLLDRWTFLKENIKHILPAILLFVLAASPQLAYWKYVTGNWTYNGYVDEGFVWTEPRIWKGLFSFQKGWFVYTPVAIFAVWGIYIMRKTLSQHIPAIVIFMTINIYVIFSWWNWWYGGSLGCRPLVEAMAIMALPLAAFIQQLLANKSIILKILCGLILIFFITLNMFQSYQLSKNIIHWDRMTRAYYIRTFFKTYATAEDEKYLLSDKEYYAESQKRIDGVKK